MLGPVAPSAASDPVPAAPAGSPPHCVPASPRFDWTPDGKRAVMGAWAYRPYSRRSSMKGRIQIVGRLPLELNRRVRAAAKHGRSA